MANYWTAFDWGKYESKTAHLPMIQHGAYILLLKHYYQTGRPLSASAEVLLRVCRAFADDEKAAVLAVLAEFFTLEADGYHNEKADEELCKSASIVQAHSKGGQARADSMSPERRTEIAKVAAKARWKTKDLLDAMPANMLAGCLPDALQLQPHSIPRIKKHSDIEEDQDHEEQIVNIFRLHPKNAHISPDRIPNIQQQMIMEAIIADGYDAVFAGVNNLRDAFNRRPRSDVVLCPNPIDFFNPNGPDGPQYLKDPILWEKYDAKRSKHDANEEAIARSAANVANGDV